MIDIPTSDAADMITAGYKAVWAILNANAAFAAAAAARNDWSDGTLSTPPPGLMPAELTEVSLVQGSFLLKPCGSNSMIAEVEQTYTLVGVSDSLQVAQVNALKWAALAAFRRNTPEDVTWGGNPFCRGFMLSGGSDGTTGVQLPGLSGPDAVRGVNRLVSIVAITLQLYAGDELLPQ